MYITYICITSYYTQRKNRVLEFFVHAAYRMVTLDVSLPQLIVYFILSIVVLFTWAFLKYFNTFVSLMGSHIT